MQEDGTQKGNGKRKLLSATYEPGMYRAVPSCCAFSEFGQINEHLLG